MGLNRNTFSSWFQKAKYYLRILLRKELLFFKDVNVSRKILGNYQAEWCIADKALVKNSIIYSIGVGTDISFDSDLIKEYNCQVFAFDPTPRSLKWLKEQDVPAGFIFQPFGVSDKDGDIIFYPPPNPDHVSFSATTNDDGLKEEGIALPVKRLRTIMNMHGHTAIDLLKMDIEGAEYGVINDMITSGIEVKQLLVEFHHRFDKPSVQKTKHAILSLKKAGYHIFYISPTGEEYSFIKQG